MDFTAAYIALTILGLLAALTYLAVADLKIKLHNFELQDEFPSLANDVDDALIFMALSKEE
jgi:hypothetical protein